MNFGYKFKTMLFGVMFFLIQCCLVQGVVMCAYKDDQCRVKYGNCSDQLPLSSCQQMGLSIPYFSPFYKLNNESDGTYTLKMFFFNGCSEYNRDNTNIDLRNLFGQGTGGQKQAFDGFLALGKALGPVEINRLRENYCREVNFAGQTFYLQLESSTNPFRSRVRRALQEGTPKPIIPSLDLSTLNQNNNQGYAPVGYTQVQNVLTPINNLIRVPLNGGDPFLASPGLRSFEDGITGIIVQGIDAANVNINPNAASNGINSVTNFFNGMTSPSTKAVVTTQRGSFLPRQGINTRKLNLGQTSFITTKPIGSRRAKGNGIYYQNGRVRQPTSAIYRD